MQLYYWGTFISPTKNCSFSYTGDINIRKFLPLYEVDSVPQFSLFYKMLMQEIKVFSCVLFSVQCFGTLGF